MALEVTNAGFIRRNPDLGWLRLVMGRIGKTQPDDNKEEILRLAETSPHLLEDLGFRKQRDGSWSNGRTRVSVPSDTAVDRLLRAGRI